jgi:hypothetical protein
MNTETQLTKQFESLVISTNVNKPVKKSWAMMAIEEEEEEAREREEEKQKLIQDQVKIRRELYAKGQYELEEGELLE